MKRIPTALILSLTFNCLHFAMIGQPHSLPLTLLKAAPVAFLAVYATGNALKPSSWLLAAALALGAAGDFAIVYQLQLGAAFFALGHICAMLLYARFPDHGLTATQKRMILLLIPASIGLGMSFAPDIISALSVGFYAAMVSGMAALALRSRFPRSLTGLGAVLFLLSDFLIFVSIGPWSHVSAAANAKIESLNWVLYYGGQVLITLGGVKGLSVSSTRSS